MNDTLKFCFLPFVAPWVKVYLVSGKKCLAKAKTSQARRTLDPLFQQQLIFSQRYGGCVLQVNCFGGYSLKPYQALILKIKYPKTITTLCEAYLK